jgi:uroporphyrinogen-III synthase
VRLLVTRGEPDGERTAAALRAHGHAVLVAPLLRVQALDVALPDQPFAAVVMTSANAARAVAVHPARGRLAALPAFTTGRHSAQAARAAGFRDVHSADGDKGDLAQLLRARLAGTQLPLLYLAGEDRAGALDLAECGLRVLTAVVYRAVKAGWFPADVEKAVAQSRLDGVTHFSRRTAEAYLDCAGAAGLLEPALALVHFCISQQVAEPLAAAGAPAIRIASRPDEAALLALVGAG